MDIFEVIDRILDVFELSEAEDERMHRVMLMSAVAVVIKTVPAPDDCEFGRTAEEIKESMVKVADIFDTDKDARAAIAEHFDGILKLLKRGSITREKEVAMRKILREYRAN